MAQRPLKIAVLVSGSGMTLQNLLDQIKASRLRAEIPLVIGSRPGLVGLDRAQRAGVRTEIVEKARYRTCEEFSRVVFDLCAGVDADLVCLAGWLCLLDVPTQFGGKVMNIHPALLPSFGGKGMFGRRVHEAVVAHGCKVSGCTVHFVDNTYDNGPIVIQRICPVLESDSPEDLARRVFAEECTAYPEAIRLFQEDRLKIEGRRVRIASR